MNILISSCLLGNNCKYNGGNNLIEGIETLKEHHNLIPICPEELGGLASPREPSEIRGEYVLSRTGTDVTACFLKGAELALNIARQHGVSAAILKARSPSCGFGEIYDGSFSGKTTVGNGITAELLSKNGIKIYNEHNWREI